jgi:phosphate-selective porin OprO/OprP
MHRHTPVAIAVLAASFGSSVHAADPAQALERIWSKATLYEGADGSFVDSVKFVGRLQADQVHIDSAMGDLSQTNLRRMRLGFKAAFAGGFTAHVEADYDPNGGDLNYNKLTDAYIAWSPGDAFGIKVGKHGAGFTLDGMTSSKELRTIDRSNLANNLWFTDEYIPGVSVEGQIGKLQYHTGIYSSGSRDRGFGGSDGGEFILATIGYDFAERLGADAALLRFNVVDNDAHPSNGFTRPLERVSSVNLVYERGRWAFATDFSSADGYFGQSDLQGASVMPSYKLSDTLELVARYTYVSSENPNGVRLARYENEVVPGRGDHYREIYAGVNYYWFGNKLKVQTGLQYAALADTAGDGGRYRGWSWTTGLRVAW